MLDGIAIKSVMLDKSLLSLTIPLRTTLLLVPKMYHGTTLSRLRNKQMRTTSLCPSRTTLILLWVSEAHNFPEDKSNALVSLGYW